MQIRIDGARKEGGELVLSVSDPEVNRWLYHFKPGQYEIRKVQKKRSLDANAYMWTLAGKIGTAVGIPAADVYRRAIHDVGVFTPLPIREDAVEEFSRIWAGHGLGWFVEVLDNSKLKGYKLVRAFNGSSTYDTKQMSALIDYLVDDAKTLGIETLSDRELSLLKEGWKP